MTQPSGAKTLALVFPESFCAFDRGFFASQMNAERPGKTPTVRELLDRVNTAEGRRKLDEIVAANGWPRFEAGPTPETLVRIDEDGSRSVGKFVGRMWVAVEKPS